MKINEQPKGKTFLTNKERQTILQLRLQKYSIKQIAEATGRATTTVKRVIYNW
ncbi:MAG: helix-turn-helix domain-containing protein [Alteromonadales bacterium]|jgi:IS30 family transposase|nr:helix-turn-helix domain-containing protein [Alteromonadales bacterium]